MKIKGISFIEGLQLLFIAYQLAGIIVWPWWWVVSPILIKWSLSNILKYLENGK